MLGDPRTYVNSSYVGVPHPMESLGKKRKKREREGTRIGTRRKGKSMILNPQGIIILLL
jgi:hypothetical protein